MDFRSSKDTFASPFITITAGDEQYKLFAHASKLCQATFFSNMISKDWRESIDAKVELKQWDVETVACMLEWLYSGDYHSPYPYMLTASSERNDSASEAEGTASASAGPSPTQSSPDATQPSQAMTPGITMCTNQTENPKITHALPQHEKFLSWARSNQHLAPSMSHSEALMTHAQLYALADYIQLIPLQKLASKRLRSHIIFIGMTTLTPAIVDDVAHLAEYLYANTIDHNPGDLGEEETIRKHISGFIAKHFAYFKGDAANVVFQGGGDLVVDICAKLRVIQMSLIESRSRSDALLKRQREEDDAHATQIAELTKRVKKTATRVTRA